MTMTTGHKFPSLAVVGGRGAARVGGGQLERVRRVGDAGRVADGAVI